MDDPLYFHNRVETWLDPRMGTDEATEKLSEESDGTFLVTVNPPNYALLVVFTGSVFEFKIIKKESKEQGRQFGIVGRDGFVPRHFPTLVKLVLYYAQNDILSDIKAKIPKPDGKLYSCKLLIPYNSRIFREAMGL